MDARTHTWIAIRAVALLEDLGDAPSLVKLLKPCVREASVGAWIPDQTDAKRGDSGSKTENHVLKIAPYTGLAQRNRFTMDKGQLLGLLGMQRLTAQYLSGDVSLDDHWWQEPYRGDVPKPGQHLPNRIMALSTMLKDLLLMGDAAIDALTSQRGTYKTWMKPGVRTRDQAAAMYFFMLSHFVADVSMPCHCDARPLSGYEGGLHKQLEAHWSHRIPTRFDRDNLLSPQQTLEQVLAQARTLDTRFGLQFAAPLPDIHAGQDEWLEAMMLCRASFAIASIMADYRSYPYDDPDCRAPFKSLFPNEADPKLSAFDTAILHDAVLNTAVFWKHIWCDISRK